jgi:hypothetical protein
MPDVPRGVDVQTRGPVHEAFATPTSEPAPTATVAKKPPAPIDEMPPTEKPEGDVHWIGGYWHWDDERSDYLWVSGCWRTFPGGRTWIPGYWREQGEQWQWVAGFWGAADKATNQAMEITYHPEPPAPPQVAPPGPAPNADSFYVPGHWVWREGRYFWVAGYWARVQPEYVWIPAHYSWTPSGYIFVPGYWDYTLARRGMLYAPVIVDRSVVGATFVYTPAYAVSDVVVVDAMWVRPCHCHYYFGDYYGPVYHRYGYESCVVYSRTHYDSIVVYRTWEHRDEPRWHETQINIYIARDAGREPRPPRTLVEQQIVLRQQGPAQVTRVEVVAPAHKIAAAHGVKTVAVVGEARVQAQAHAQALRTVAVQQRVQVETKTVGVPTAPRTASVQVPANALHRGGPAGATGQAGAGGTHIGAAAGTAGAAAGGKTGGPIVPHPGTPGSGPAHPTVGAGSHGPVPPPPAKKDDKKDDKKEHKPGQY